MSPATASSSSTADESEREARAAVLASLQAAGSHYDGKLQSRAGDVQNNAAAIAKQEAQVANNTTALAKETAKLQKAIDHATKGVNEIGHVQNWAEMLERDLMTLEETLRLAEDGERVESASGGSAWRPS